ncbi:MAG: hypothetical protein ABSE27_03480 [Acidobacteriaceae bacterium]|jgi:hypothetical protein
MAQSTTQTASLSTPITPREVHSLMLSAHNSVQYQQLAGYFHQQEAKFRAEAAAEKIERDRRAQVNAGLTQKYPRPVDSAQYLYESYLSQADSAALQAQHFDQLAAAQTQHEQQFATASQGKL